MPVPYKNAVVKSAPSLSRTGNPLLRTEMLYPFELWGRTYGTGTVSAGFKVKRGTRGTGTAY